MTGDCFEFPRSGVEGKHLMHFQSENFLRRSTSFALVTIINEYSRTPIETATLGEVDSGRLREAGRLIEVKTIEKPSLGF